MRYEILRTYKDVVGANWLARGSPLEIRLYREDTDPQSFFTALIKSAYLLAHRGSSIIPLSEEEITSYFRYPVRRSILDIILKRPETRLPVGIHAPIIRTVPTHLILEPHTSECYDMQTHNFIREVDFIDRLIEFTQEELTRSNH